MAAIRLPRAAAERGDLPKLCLCCGAPAPHAPARLFYCYPSWLPDDWWREGQLIYGPLAYWGRKQAVVRTPLCPRHANYWRWRDRFTWGGLWLFAVAGVAIGCFLAASGPDDIPGLCAL